MSRVYELTLALPPARGVAVLRQLREHPLLAGVVPLNGRVITIYHDCANGTLARHGWCVALEQSQRRRHLQLSRIEPALPGVMVRTTWSVPVSIAAQGSLAAAGQIDPASFSALQNTARLPKITGALRAVRTLTLQRTLWRLPVAGLIVDLVLERGYWVVGERRETVHELRIAASDATRPEAELCERLFAIAADMQQALPVLPLLHGGAACAFAWPDDTPGVPVRARAIDLAVAATPRDALGAIGANIVQHWFANQAGARDTDDSEYIHQLRVALRRLKTALKMFDTWVDPDWRGIIVPDLKWLGGVLGTARDWDVFVETTLVPLVAAATGPDGNEGNWPAVRSRAERERETAREAVRGALRSSRYARFTLQVLHWLASLRAHSVTAEGEAPTLRDYARARLSKYHKRIGSAPDLTTLSEAERHEERILAKRLRYAMEFFAPLLEDRPRRRALKVVGRVQEILGAGNDASVALRLAERLQLDAEQHGFVRGWLAATQTRAASEAQELRATLPKPKLLAKK